MQSYETQVGTNAAHPHKRATASERDRHEQTVAAKAARAGGRGSRADFYGQGRDAADLVFVQPVQAGVKTPKAPPVAPPHTPIWDDANFGHNTYGM